jgi:hypothetical protein
VVEVDAEVIYYSAEEQFGEGSDSTTRAFVTSAEFVLESETPLPLLESLARFDQSPQELAVAGLAMEEGGRKEVD